VAINFGGGINLGVGAPSATPIGMGVNFASDPTYSISISGGATSVNEGASLTCNVTTTNVGNGTTLYWTISNVTTSNTDFSPYNGSFTITSNAGSFSISPIADVTTEGSETCTVSVRTVSISGTVVATSNSITVNDTSIAPVRYSYLFTAGNAAALEILSGQTNMTDQFYALDDNAYNVPWTCEGWFNSIGTTGSASGNHQTIFNWKTYNQQGMSVFIDATTGLLDCKWNQSWGINSGGSAGIVINFNTWYHFAFTHHYSGGDHVYNVYLNGNLAVTRTYSYSSFGPHNIQNMANVTFDIGGEFAGNNYSYRPFNGYISNLRLVKNIRVYTGNFTVPTAPLTATQSAGTNISAITGTDYNWPYSGSRTVLLTAQSNSFVDNSANGLTITNRTGYSGYSGSVVTSTQNPFS